MDENLTTVNSTIEKMDVYILLSTKYMNQLNLLNENAHLIFSTKLLFLAFSGIFIRITNILKLLMYIEFIIATLIYSFLTIYVYEVGATSIYSAVFALLLITLGAAEAAIAISIVILNYRHENQVPSTSMPSNITI